MDQMYVVGVYFPSKWKYIVLSPKCAYSISRVILAVYYCNLSPIAR